MKIFIPSFNRARAVFALDVFPTASVVVPASQEAEYRKCNPNATIVPIPDDQDGNLARKRNAIAALGSKEPDGAFVVVDDDIYGLWDKQAARAVRGPEAVAVLEALAVRASARGAVVFGVHPSKRAPFNPEAEWETNRGLFHLYGFRGESAVSRAWTTCSSVARRDSKLCGGSATRCKSSMAAWAVRNEPKPKRCRRARCWPASGALVW